MAINKKLLAALFIAILVCSSIVAKSKKKTDNGLKTSVKKVNAEKERTDGEEEESSAEAEWQYLEWEEEYPEYVLKYEVVIEAKENDEAVWAEINRLQTEDNTTKVQVQPLLTPGLYRYKVITYNLIGIPEIESDWFEFNIFRAYIPQVRSIEANVSHTSTIYFDEVNDGLFTVNGRNLFELQEGLTDTSFTSYSVVNSRKNTEAPITPHILEFSENNRRLKVQFNLDELDTGTYYFTATDASGLISEFNKDSQFTIKFRKAVDFDVAAGYTCPVIVIGDKMKEYLNTSVLPLSATAKISFMPFKRRFGYLGIGIDALYSRLITNTEGYDLDGNYICGNALFIYQLPIRIKNKRNPEKLRHIATLELHGGAGLSMFNNTVFHFPHNINSDPLNSLDFCATAGLSGQLYITTRLYVELGADFVMPFMGDLLMGYVKPVAGVGWQF